MRTANRSLDGDKVAQSFLCARPHLPTLAMNEQRYKAALYVAATQPREPALCRTSLTLKG